MWLPVSVLQGQNKRDLYFTNAWLWFCSQKGHHFFQKRMENLGSSVFKCSFFGAPFVAITDYEGMQCLFNPMLVRCFYSKMTENSYLSLPKLTRLTEPQTTANKNLSLNVHVWNSCPQKEISYLPVANILFFFHTFSFVALLNRLLKLLTVKPLPNAILRPLSMIRSWDVFFNSGSEILRRQSNILYFFRTCSFIAF